MWSAPQAGEAKPGGDLAAFLDPARRSLRYNQLHRTALQAVLNWANDTTPGVHLVLGGAGEGKTRLLVEAFARLSDGPAAVGWAPPGLGPDAVEAARDLRQRAVLLVDDADQRNDLAALLTAAVRIGSPELRIVLAFRGPALWWLRFRATLPEDVAARLPADPHTRLPALIADESALHHHFSLALRSFGAREGAVRLSLGKERLPVSISLVYAAASAVARDGLTGAVDLTDAVDRARESGARPGTSPVLEERWAVGQLADDPGRAGLDGPEFRRALAVIARATRHTPQAVSVLSALVSKAPPEWLSLAVTAGEDAGQDFDQALSEGFAARTELGREALVGLAEQAAPLPRTHRVLQQRLGTSSAAEDPQQSLAATEKTVALLRESDDLPALATALERLSQQQAVAARPHEALASGEEAVALIEHEPSVHGPELASALDNLSRRLGGAGDQESSTTVATRAVEHCRTLALTHPSAYGPALSKALDTLSRRLAQAGRHAEALAAAEEAAVLARELYTNWPELHEAALAIALNGLTRRQAAMGHSQDALRTAEEAVTLCRSAAEREPALLGPRLATSLTALGDHLAAAGQAVKAQEAFEEAVAVLRQAAETDAVTFGPVLAGVLNNLSRHLDHTGNTDQALAAARESVRRFAEATAVEPNGAHEPNAAAAHFNLSALLHAAGHRQAAIDEAQETIRRYRTLQQQWPEGFDTALAAAQRHLRWLKEEGQPGAAGSSPRKVSL